MFPSAQLFALKRWLLVAGAYWHCCVIKHWTRTIGDQGAFEKYVADMKKLLKFIWHVCLLNNMAHLQQRAPTLYTYQHSMLQQKCRLLLTVTQRPCGAASMKLHTLLTTLHYIPTHSPSQQSVVSLGLMAIMLRAHKTMLHVNGIHVATSNAGGRVCVCTPATTSVASPCFVPVPVPHAQ